jgi:hypothetical protein
LAEGEDIERKGKMRLLKGMVGCLLMLVMGTGWLRAEVEGAPTSIPSVRLGVEGGFNVASLNGPDANAVYESRLGFVGGAFLIIPLGSSFSIHPEMIYSQKGGRINGNDYQADYFEVPVLADIRIIGPLSLLAGPSFNALVSNRNIQNVNNMDTGLIGGVQVLLGPIVVTGRYEIGLNDLNDTERAHNGTFTFMAGLCFI